MKQKSTFAEIIFKDEYYIDGVNIFDNDYRIFEKNIDVILKLGFRQKLSYFNIFEASLYTIHGKDIDFKIFIKKIRDFYIIGYLSSSCFLRQSDFMRLYHKKNKKIALEDYEKNTNIFYEIALKNDVRLDNCIYSNNGKVRAIISVNGENIKVDYEQLCVYDEYCFHFKEDISSSNFFSWESLGETSYYETKDLAEKDIIERLNLLEKSQLDPHYY